MLKARLRGNPELAGGIIRRSSEKVCKGWNVRLFGAAVWANGYNMV